MVDATRCFFLFFLGCTVASRGGYQMARGRHYAKLSLSNAARLSFSDLCILLFMFLSLCRLCVCVFLCSHWSLVDVPLIFFCPADHVPDWQPRVLLGMVEARSVNVKKTTTTTTTCTRTVNLKIISTSEFQAIYVAESPAENGALYTCHRLSKSHILDVCTLHTSKHGDSLRRGPTSGFGVKSATPCYLGR